MAEPKLVALVDQLVKRTRAGKIPWEKTVDEAVFQASFPQSTVKLLMDGAAVTVRVYDEEGTLVAQITDEDIKGSIDGTPPFTAMKAMYELAMRSSSGIDRVLDSLLSELSE